MLRSLHSIALILAFIGLGAVPALAQNQSTDLGGCKTSQINSLTFDRFPVKTEQGVEEFRMMLSGSPEQPVKIDCDETQLFADKMEIFDGHQVVATGNVLYVSGGNRIAAERLEFDTKTRTGTFFNASGTVSLADRGVDRSMFGTQEPDAYFRGEEIHKLGPDKYKIVHGAFTTCVQPTPRWEMVAGSVTLQLDDHALLTNSVLRVKGVPVLYLPIFYYPVQEDDRATGFLLPVYGSSTVRGQTLSNAFFWAINRSSDLTLMHDWYSKTGQSYGGEYRYQLGGGNRGATSFNILDEHAATYTLDDGSTSSIPAAKNFSMRGGLSQALGFGLHARANVDYTTDLEVRQRYEQDIYRATNPTRNIDGNVTGNWREYVLSATLNRRDLFYTGQDTLTATGALPRISFNRGERTIGNSKIYFGANSEFVTMLWRTKQEGVVTDDRGLSRLDVNPVVRIPFTKFPFFTVNSSVSWRGTYWTESVAPVLGQVPDSIGRGFFDFEARITGPVFNRIFNRPNSGYAQKLKHVIEPTVVIKRTTAIDQFDKIVKNDAIDSIPGDVTRIVYGLNNRLYAKRESSREIVGVSVQQTYIHRRAGLPVRPELPEHLQRRGDPVELLASATPGPGVAGRSAADGFLHRVEHHGRHVHRLRVARHVQYRAHAAGRGLEPAPADPRAAGVLEPGAGEQRHQRDCHGAEPGEPSRRDLLVQLRPPERLFPAAAHHRLLQRAVLRDRGGVSERTIWAGTARSSCRRTSASTCPLRWRASARSRISSARSAETRAGSAPSSWSGVRWSSYW